MRKIAEIETPQIRLRFPPRYALDLHAGRQDRAGRFESNGERIGRADPVLLSRPGSARCTVDMQAKVAKVWLPGTPVKTRLECIYPPKYLRFS